MAVESTGSSRTNADAANILNILIYILKFDVTGWEAALGSSCEDLSFS